MKITDISIQGLPQLNNIDLNNLCDFNVFIGPNNSGKSTILNSLWLLSVFNKKDITLKKDYVQADDNRILNIKYTFNASMDEIYGSLAKYKEIFKTFKPEMDQLVINHGFSFTVDIQYNLGKRSIQNRDGIFNHRIKIKDIELWEENQFMSNQYPLNFDGLSNSLTQYFRDYIMQLISPNSKTKIPSFIYLSIDRLELNRENLIALRDSGYSKTEYDSLVKLFHGFYSHFPEVKHTSGQTYAIIGKNPDDSEIQIPFNLEGEGCQRCFQIYNNIYLLNFNRKDTTASRKFNGFRPIIIVDEPEISMHPGLQRELMHLFLEYSQYIQIFIATHSSIFANPSKNKSVYLFPLTRSSEKVKIIDKIDVSEITYALGLRNEDYLLYSSILFIEGDTEEEFLSTICNNYQLDLFSYGIEVVNMHGVSYLKQNFIDLIINLMLKYNLNITIVTDNEDNPEERKKEIIDKLTQNSYKNNFSWNILEKDFESLFSFEFLYDSYKEYHNINRIPFDIIFADFKSLLDGKEKIGKELSHMFYEKTNGDFSKRKYGTCLALTYLKNKEKYKEEKGILFIKILLKSYNIIIQ